MKNQKLFTALIASAVAGMAMSATAVAADKAAFYCQNNSCKGNSACKGHGNDSCSGQNGCKGHGFVKADNKADCVKAKGKWVKDTGAKKDDKKMDQKTDS